jgi:hypothetical protein
MSRWSRKTNEEKAEILKKQRELRNKTSNKGKDIEALDIYRNKEIPIFCTKCYRYSGSDNYELVIKDFRPIGMKNISMVKGICRNCKKPIERVFPNALYEESIIFAAICANLKREGRLKDLRKK